MNFNNHSDLQGKHAQFSPSSSAWLRYTDEKIVQSYSNRNRKTLGTELHDYASSQIELLQKATNTKSMINGVATFIFTKYKMLDQLDYGKMLIHALKELPEEIYETVKLFINDAIGYKMSSEITLVYSKRFFGTTDAISFRNNFLRVHDLKSGDGKADFEQLLIYVGLFCLEYKIKPADIQIECRIYQFGEWRSCEPSVDVILPIMDKIVISEKILIPRVEEEEN